MEFDSTAASGWTRASVVEAVPAAASMEHSTNADAWSTFHCEQCQLRVRRAVHRVLGATGGAASRPRPRPAARRRDSPPRPRLNPAQSSARSRAWCSHRLAARRAQRGLDHRVLGGRDREAGGDLGCGMISASGDEHLVGRARRPARSRLLRARDRARRSRYLASPPTTSATSSSPRAIAVHARVNSDCCRMPISPTPCARRRRSARPAAGPGRGSATCRAARAPSARARGATACCGALARERHQLDRLQRHRRVVDVLVRDAGARRGPACAGPCSCYFRWKFGVRFSANAFGPSFESSDPITASRVAHLVCERLVLAHVLGLVQGLQDRLDRERAVGGDRRGDLARLVECLAVGHDVADQADLLGLGREDVLAGEEDVGRHRVRDLALQAHRGTAHRVERPARLRHAEARALAGDADVGALQDLGATRDGDAFDRGDDRLRGPVRLEQPAVHEAGILLEARLFVDRAVGVDVARHRAQVHARREVALGAGEDGAAEVVVRSAPATRRP